MEVAAFHPRPFQCELSGARLVSVALFLAFAAALADDLSRLGVTQHPALRSPDFPLPARFAPAGSDGLADFGRNVTTPRRPPSSPNPPIHPFARPPRNPGG